MRLSLFISQRIYKKRQGQQRKKFEIVPIARAAVILGVAVMTIAIGTGLGLQKEIQKKLAVINGHIQITYYDNNESYRSFPISLKQDFYPEFKAVPEVKHIQVFAFLAGVIKSEGSFEGVALKGLSSDFSYNDFSGFVREGKVPSFALRVPNDSIAISGKLAKALDVNIGERLTMYFLRDEGLPLQRRFTVSGIFSTGIPDFDENIILGDIRHIRKLNRWAEDEAGGFELMLSSIKNMDKTEREIYASIPYNLNTSSLNRTQAQLMEWVAMFDVNIYLIIGIMILVCGVNILTMLLILVLEQIKLVGTLKALGAQNGTVSAVFLRQAMNIVLSGVFWGNLAGLSILAIQHFTGLLRLDPDIYNVEKVPVYFNLVWWAALNAGTILACYLILLLPTATVANTQPSKVLRFS